MAMRILCCINEKGGTGKSSLCSNISTALHRSGKRVVLVDADPQGTLRDWRDASPEGADLPPVVAIDRPQLLQSSLKTLSAYEYVVIDGPAKADDMLAAIIRVSDLALIVIQPSGADIWASAAAVKLVQSKIAVGGHIEAAFLINRVSGIAKLSKSVVSGEWNSYGIDQLSSTIGNRVSFAQALTDGVSIYDLADGQAKAEVDLLVQELEARLWV